MIKRGDGSQIRRDGLYFDRKHGAGTTLLNYRSVPPCLLRAWSPGSSEIKVPPPSRRATAAK